MRATALGEAAIATALAVARRRFAGGAGALRRTAHPLAGRIRSDPGAVLLLVRHRTRPFGSPTALRCSPNLLTTRRCSKTRSASLELPQPGFVDWNQPAVRPIYRVRAWPMRERPSSLAEQAGAATPDTPGSAVCWRRSAGWPSAPSRPAAARLPGRPGFAARPDAPPSAGTGASTSRRSPGAWPGAGGCRRGWRRSSATWRLPESSPRQLGADPDLFPVVQLAVGSGTGHGHGLGLARRGRLDRDRRGPGSAAQRSTRRGAQQAPTPDRPSSVGGLGIALRCEPLLRDLLAVAAENRRLAERPCWNVCEREVDLLHRALEDAASRTRPSRLQAAKLERPGRVRRRRRPRDQQPAGRHLRAGPVPARPLTDWLRNERRTARRTAPCRRSSARRSASTTSCAT